MVDNAFNGYVISIYNEFLVSIVDPNNIAFVADSELVRDDLVTSRIDGGCTTIIADAMQSDHNSNRITL